MRSESYWLLSDASRSDGLPCYVAGGFADFLEGVFVEEEVDSFANPEFAVLFLADVAAAGVVGCVGEGAEFGEVAEDVTVVGGKVVVFCFGFSAAAAAGADI